MREGRSATLLKVGLPNSKAQLECHDQALGCSAIGFSLQDVEDMHY